MCSINLIPTFRKNSQINLNSSTVRLYSKLYHIMPSHSQVLFPAIQYCIFLSFFMHIHVATCTCICWKDHGAWENAKFSFTALGKIIHSEELHPSIALWTINSGLLAHQLWQWSCEKGTIKFDTLHLSVYTYIGLMCIHSMLVSICSYTAEKCCFNLACLY